MSPENLENKSNFDSWGLTLVAYKKGVNQDYFLQSFDVIVNALTERVFRWDPKWKFVSPWNFFFKFGLSPSKKNYVICFIESCLKMMKNDFYFILKALLVFKIFKFLSWLLDHVGKTAWCRKNDLMRKAKLRILTVKNHRQIKIQRLKKYKYGHLGCWCNKSNLYKRLLNWNKIFKKIKQLLAKLRSLWWKWCVFNVGASTKKWYPSFLKKVFVFQKICFKVKVLKTIKIFTNCRIKTCQSIKRRAILKIPSTFFRITYALFVGFKMKPLRKSIFQC